MERRHVQVLWRLTAGLITVGAVVWVLLLISQAWPDVAANAHQIGFGKLVVGSLLLAVSAYLTFLVFALLARAAGISGMRQREMAHLYFSGQLLKHLPGRVWGLGYQWAASRSVASLGHWVFINASHMVLATYFALWSSAFVVSVVRCGGCGLVTAAAGLLLFASAWLVIRSARLSRLVARLPGRSASMALGGVRVLAKLELRQQWMIFLLLGAGSLAYYTAWAAFGAGYERVGWQDGLYLGALYLVAWFVGYVSLLAPSGIGVRELVFAWMARDFQPDEIAMMAIVGRVGMLSVDVVLGALLLPFAPKRK